MIPRMRITVAIDDDVLAAARALAARNRCTLGRALSELARRGLGSPSPARKGEDDAMVAVPADAEAINSEDVYRSLDDWP